MRNTLTLLTALLLAPWAALQAVEPVLLDRCNVVWDSPSADSRGSMPAGNGDVGINLWVEPSGDLVLLISKTDAWDENMRLVKIGKLRVRFEPALTTASGFRQALNLREGAIEIQNPKTKIRVWVDANHPVVQVDAKSLDGQPLAATATAELWRTSKQPCNPGYPNFASLTPFSWPDTVLKATARQIGWYHCNAVSPWRDNLKLQKLEAVAEVEKDPILGRTFGAIVRGDNFVAASDTTLKTAAPARELSLRVHVLTSTADGWQPAIEKQADVAEKVADRWAAHGRWWDEFWNRSWIFVDGNAAAESVTGAYTLQRWMNACAGRGAFPIKFNGSIFTVERADKRGFDADFRAWGGCYWFQNTRLLYWPMPATGDFDLMPALFNMYLKALPVRRLATKTYYGHSGAFFPETMTFWGTYNDKNYGPNRTNKADGLTDNGYIRRYWQGGLELVALMLDNYDFTQDAKFRDATLLPFANEIITFYDQHWKRGAEGKILFEPAQSLETWWTCTNPLPEIAGLRYVIPRLQQISGTNAWQKTLDDLPPVPFNAEKKCLLPAVEFASKHNSENPELYAVFPYRLYGVGKPDLDVARETWRRRQVKGSGCWRQDPVQAALLGLADEAQALVTSNAKHTDKVFRFPVFWGPGFDWLPDEDHGGVLMSALQSMLVQYDDRKIYLLPAWPKNWNVSFKLHAPKNTVVEGEYRNGKITELKVSPASRRADIQLILPGVEVQK